MRLTMNCSDSRVFPFRPMTRPELFLLSSSTYTFGASVIPSSAIAFFVASSTVLPSTSITFIAGLLIYKSDMYGTVHSLTGLFLLCAEIYEQLMQNLKYILQGPVQ